MIRHRSALTAAIAILVPLLGANAPAQAANREGIVITEYLNFNADPAITTFTSTDPLCDTGSFADDVTVVKASRHHATLRIQTVFTCDDGSGTFDATKLIVLTYIENGYTNVGTIHFHGGTGLYTELRGHGLDVGSTTNGIGHGHIEAIVSGLD